jgi:hypothetical protein
MVRRAPGGSILLRVPFVSGGVLHTAVHATALHDNAAALQWVEHPHATAAAHVHPAALHIVQHALQPDVAACLITAQEGGCKNLRLGTVVGKVGACVWM